MHHHKGGRHDHGPDGRRGDALPHDRAYRHRSRRHGSGGRGADASGIADYPGERRFARDPLERDIDHAPHGSHPRDRGERGSHRHGGRRRLFDHGDLRFILLRMIADKPAHGYDLIKALEERMGGGYSPSPGVIYPTLTLLEEQGYADVTAEGGKKLYRATAEGQAYLQANQPAVEAIQIRIDAVAKERNAMLPAPVLRALENLKTALRLRLAGGPIEPERAATIAAAIDAAAAEAERTGG